MSSSTPAGMLPKVITVAGQKGGVAKSTIVIALAVEWHLRGFRVLVVDSDEKNQKSVCVWSERAAAFGHDAPPVVFVGDDLKVTLPQIIRGHDLVIIDTPGHLVGRVAHAIGLSDLVLLPCSKNHLEVWGMGMATAPAVHALQSVSRKLDVAIVINRVRKDTQTGQRTARTLAATGFHVLETYLERRDAYDEAIGAGKGPTTYKQSDKACGETRALADEILERLGLPKTARRAARSGNAAPRGKRRADSARPAARRTRVAARGARPAAAKGPTTRRRNTGR